MPEVNEIEGLKLIKSKHPELKVLMQTAFDDSEKIYTSIKNGVSGYILKNDRAQRILQAIEEVYEGGAVMNPAIAQKVLDYFKPVEKKSPLSPKENEVIALLADGLSYKMVAYKLAVSYTTINTHTKPVLNYKQLHTKAKKAFQYCKANKLNTQFAILIDMSRHSGLNRFYVWSFAKDTFTHSFPVSHGCGNSAWAGLWSSLAGDRHVRHCCRYWLASRDSRADDGNAAARGSVAQLCWSRRRVDRL